MMTHRPAAERGKTKLDWLDSWHSFSFAEYRDPSHVRFRTLRVINEDIVAPGAGFGMHGHQDMEIITYMLGGTLEHKDSIGSIGQITPGEVQRMSAGTGIRHSEYNASDDVPAHLLQIWVFPRRNGLQPGYEQKQIDFQPGKLSLIAAPDGGTHAVTIHQDAWISAARMQKGESITHKLERAPHVWVQVAKGTLTVNGQAVGAGDGLGISDEQTLMLSATTDAEVLVFELA
ncbi:MAG: pirin family protein [Proteobacteria bacterium]|nr:pirin family protein [Pseudomonadota bacterium]